MAQIKKISTELQLLDKLLDTSGDSGTSGQVLSSTGTGTNWINVASGTVTTSSSGSTGFIPKFTSSTALADSILEVNSALPNDLIMPQYIRHTGDTNTYFGFYTSDVFIIATDATERMRVNSGGTVLVNRTSNAVSGAKFSINGMSEFETTLTNNEDWQNSPISIGERGNVGSGQTANKYAPNLNFHWSGVTSKSLWLGADGHLSFGEYLSDGTPTADGTFLVNTIGIGTTSPARKLHINAGSANEAVRIESTDTEVALELKDLTGTAVIRSRGDFRFDGSSGEIMRMEAGGNVGIGTTSPAVTLHVDGFARLNGGLQLNQAGAVQIYQIQNNDLKFGTNNTERMRINSSGNVGIGTTNPQSGGGAAGWLSLNGTAAYSGGIVYTIDSTTKGYSYFESDYLKQQAQSGFGQKFIVDGTTTAMTILDSGNVGIGTTSPTAELHVNGNLELKAAWQIGSNDGNYWQRIRTEDSSATDANAFNFETRNGSGSFITHTTILNNGNVGIGTTSPGQKLEVAGRIRATTDPTFEVYNSSANRGGIQWSTGVSGTNIFAGGNGTANAVMTFQTNTSERMRINSTGDVGIGTIQHTAGNTWRGFFVGSSASIISRQAATGTDAMFSNNFYINSSNVDKRITTGGASRIFINQDVMRFQRSASGSTDTTISWSESMRIDSSGKVGIGTTSPNDKLSVAGGDIGLYGSTSGGAVTHRTLHFYTSEDAEGLSGTNKQAIGEISFSGKDSSQNATGKYAHIKSYVIDANNLIQGSLAEGGQLEFTILRHDVSTEARVEHTALTINNSANVGIGTTSPGAKLDVVVSDVSVVPNGSSSAVFRRNGDNYISILSSTSGEGGVLFGNSSDAVDGWIAYKNGSGNQYMTIGTADTERMRITSGGNVGIGTTG
jgi:hypothetical protein